MKNFKLNNGMSIVLRSAGSKNTSVCLMVKVGHLNEPKLGIANLLEKTLLLQCNGVIPAFGGTMTAYTASGSDLDAIVARVAKILDGTIINDEFLSKAKAIIVKQTHDISPLAMRRAKLEYKHRAYGSDLVKTTEEYIDAINSYTVDEVREFANAYYTGANMVLVVAGRGFGVNEAKQLVEKYFGDVAPGKIISFCESNIYTGGAGRIDVEGSTVRLMFGWDLFGMSDAPTCNVLMSMFLRRLERAYAEAGYSDVSVDLKIAGYYGLRTMRVFVMSQSVDAKTLTDVFVKALNRICDTNASDYRMERSRNAAMAEKLNKYDASDDCALEVAWQLIGRGQVESCADSIYSIWETSADDVRCLACDIFRGSRLTYIVAQSAEKDAYSYAEVMQAIGLENLLKENEKNA